MIWRLVCFWITWLCTQLGLSCRGTLHFVCAVLLCICSMAYLAGADTWKTCCRLPHGKNGWYSSGFDYPVKTAGYRRLPAGGCSICRIKLYPAAGDPVTELLCRLLLAVSRDDSYSVIPYSCNENRLASRTAWLSCENQSDLCWKTEKRAFFYLINKEHVTTCNISQGGQY